MKKSFAVLAAFIAIFVLAAPAVYAGEGPETGNAFKYFYQWLRDADGDGIPNGLDPDYVKPADGTGYGPGPGTGDGDCDGDGIPDRLHIRTRDRICDGDGDAACIRHANEYNKRLRNGK